MRIYKAIQNIIQYKNDVCVEQRRAQKNPKSTYVCSNCKYESDRLFNVQRHEDRIHCKRRLRLCCGSKFYNKGDYYMHCERFHPHTRSQAITSKIKYKIVNESFTSKHQLRYERVNDSYNLRLKQQYSEKLCFEDQKLRTELRSDLSLKYLFTCRDVDIEDIPLISFLTDERLKPYLNNSSFEKVPIQLSNETDANSRGQEQRVQIAIASKEDNTKNEEGASEGEVRNHRTEVSNLSVSSSTCQLPAKKLILQRFRSTSLTQECETVLREQNNNCDEQTNFTGNQSDDHMLQSRSRNYKRLNRANKENAPKASFSLKEQLTVRLDRDIKGPMVTELHRSFLGAIDFDKFKILISIRFHAKENSANC